MTRRILKSSALFLGLAAVLATAACKDDALTPPIATGGDIFARYVAIGNSITAGFQSGGINDSTQRESYAVLLAAQMGTEFNIPSLNYPGCPPPLVNIFTQEVVPGGAGVPCALRAEAPELLHNVAVPGAQVIDAINNLAPGNSANALTSFILGGRTQVEAARRISPTFVTVWIGNNDALGAATAGDATLLTPPATFEAQYRQMMDSLIAMGVENGVLIGTVKVTAAPFLTAGAAWFGASMTPGALPPTFTVAANCAPAAFGGVGETTLVPFTYGFGFLMAQALGGTPVTLDCVADAQVLATAETQQVLANVAAYNAAIQAIANEFDWAYWDPNTVLDSLFAAGAIPLFPNAAGPASITTPFGSILSRDGIHPSAFTHRLVTNSLIDVINQKYGTSLANITP